MKTSVVLSAVLSFGILGLAAGFVASRLTEDAGAATGSPSASELARVHERLAALESEIEALGRLGSDVEALKRRGERQDSVEEPAASAAAVEEESAAAPPREEGEIQPTKLERWLEGQGMRGEFDDLVSRVYQQARNARMARERAEQEERAREMKALSEGPYGKFNYRVNSLSKKLGLDARQEEYVYNMLLKYDERRKQELDQTGQLEGDLTPDQVRERMDHTLRVHQELNQQFESDLLAGLNPKQQEAYQDLPEHERGSGDWEKMRMITFESGAGIVGMKTNVQFAVPFPGEKPVPPPNAPPPERK